MIKNNYLENQVMTATQDKLLIMMYEGAVNFLKRLDIVDFERDIETRNYNIKKASAIITELQCTLNMDYKDIAEPLFALYDYMRNRLLEANLQKKKEYVDEVITMLNELKSSFMAASAIVTPVIEKTEEASDKAPVYESVSFSG